MLTNIAMMDATDPLWKQVVELRVRSQPSFVHRNQYLIEVNNGDCVIAGNAYSNTGSEKDKQMLLDLVRVRMP